MASHPSASEMDREELQEYVNLLLGAKGLENVVTEAKSD